MSNKTVSELVPGSHHEQQRDQHRGQRQDSGADGGQVPGPEAAFGFSASWSMLRKRRKGRVPVAFQERVETRSQLDAELMQLKADHAISQGSIKQLEKTKANLEQNVTNHETTTAVQSETLANAKESIMLEGSVSEKKMEIEKL